MHGNAKEQAEMDSEKEIIEISSVQAMEKNKYGDIEKEDLESYLDDNAGEEKTEVLEDDENLVVKFIESNRYYKVDANGNVEKIELIIDNNPGDVTIGINGESLDGTEENPYEIWCIEDLVAFSNMTNGSGYKLQNGEAVAVTSLEEVLNKYIVLKRDLNFKSTLSYTDSERTDFGDINGDDTDGNIIMTEMATGSGFMPIGKLKNFQGNFDGNNKEIKNIYINSDKAALFSTVDPRTENVVIKNLILTGNIVSSVSDTSVAGICASVTGTGGSYTLTIENCKNYASITLDNTSGYIGGIVGTKGSNPASIIIKNCFNYGEVKGGGQAGGIIGFAYVDTSIINCGNKANIESTYYVGGIAGYLYNQPRILNCYNLGNLKSEDYAGGIAGAMFWSETKFINCYNAGNIEGKTKGGIAAYANISDELLTMKNCYFIDGTGIGNRNCDAILCTKEELKEENIVNVFNNYIETTTDIDTSTWNKWKVQKNDYPTFNKSIE